MPQLHHLAGLDGERGRARGLDLRDQRLDAVGDGNAVLVELVLPEEAVHQRALERHFGREALAARALMGKGANDLVQTDHDGLLFGLIVMEKTAPGNRRVCTAREGVACSDQLSYGLMIREDSNLRPCEPEVTELFT